MAKEKNENMKVVRDIEKRVGLVKWKELGVRESSEILELNLFPLMSRAASGGVFWGICEISMTFGSLSADGWGYFPVLLVVWHDVFSTGACKQLGGARSWC